MAFIARVNVLVLDGGWDCDATEDIKVKKGAQ